MLVKSGLEQPFLHFKLNPGITGLTETNLNIKPLLNSGSIQLYSYESDYIYADKHFYDLLFSSA